MQVLTPSRAPRLPLAVLQLVLGFMTPNEIVLVAGACKRFRQEAQKPVYWEVPRVLLQLGTEMPFTEYKRLVETNLEYISDPDRAESLLPEQQAKILAFVAKFNEINNLEASPAVKRATYLKSGLVRQLTSTAMTQVRSMQPALASVVALDTLGELSVFEQLWTDHMLGVYMGSIDMSRLDPYAYFAGTEFQSHKFEILLAQFFKHVAHQTTEIHSTFPPHAFTHIWESTVDRFHAEVLFKLVNYLCESSLDFVPHVFACLQAYNTKLLELCPESSQEFLGAPFSHWVTRFIVHQSTQFRELADQKVHQYAADLEKSEQETEKFLWSNVAKTSEKTNFLTSFKRALWDDTQTTAPEPAAGADGASPNIETLSSPTTEAEAQVAVLLSKAKGIQGLLNLELVLALIESVRSSFVQLRKFSILKGQVATSAQQEMKVLFTDLVRIAGIEHTQIGFNKAIQILNEYNPKQHRRLISTEAGSEDHAVEPLALFAELINVSDLMLQTLHVFFREELVKPRTVDPNDFSSPVINAKRKFEQMLDDKVAEGLNRGVDVLIDQIDFIFMTEQLGSDFNPFPQTVADLGPTTAARDVVTLVKTHIDQLSRSLDKSVLEVFEYEVGMRLWTSLCKHIKRSTVSIEGAMVLISDVNYYHSYIVSLKQRQLYPYYDALKEVAQLYLISSSDSKQLGVAISDLNRFRGVVPSDELLEFMRSRADWSQIKHKVEKVLYGFGECVVQ